MILDLIFEIPRKILINANALSGMHYHDKGNRARKLRELGYEQTKDLTTRFNQYEIEVVVYAPTRRRLDPPNLYPTVKHLIDGITDAQLWVDDDWKHMTKMSFSYGGLVKEEFPELDKNNFVVKLVIIDRGD